MPAMSKSLMVGKESIYFGVVSAINGKLVIAMPKLKYVMLQYTDLLCATHDLVYAIVTSERFISMQGPLCVPVGKTIGAGVTSEQLTRELLFDACRTLQEKRECQRYLCQHELS